MENQSWKIYWNEYAKDAYIYGTELLFHAKDDVEFKNELMPPGTVIKRWFSKVNYQAARIEPALPMIDGEGRYYIRLNADTEPYDGLILKLIFYDRYGQEAGFQIVRDGEAHFRCPLKTFSYEVQLINGGITQLHFHSIIITEVTDGEQKTLSHLKKSKESTADRERSERRRPERED